MTVDPGSIFYILEYRNKETGSFVNSSVHFNDLKLKENTFLIHFNFRLIIYSNTSRDIASFLEVNQPIYYS
jgi:hypothetical protein